MKDFTNSEAIQIVKSFNLQAHPEGGYFKETYRSAGSISPENLEADYSGSRNYSTAIYFLLTSDTFSAFHRIKQDECWHFYKGSAIKIHMISPEGAYSHIVLGSDFNQEQAPQFVVPGGFWFAAEVIDPSSFSLVGCTVSPGFDFADFELADREAFTQKFPQHKELILKFTRESNA